MEIDEYTLESLDNLIQNYAINRHVSIEHDKEVTVENRKMRTTVLSGLFSSGMTVYTNTIECWIKEDPKNKLQTDFRRKYIMLCLLRHVSGDWGKLCLEDFDTNEDCLSNDERLMSVYEIDNQTIWIITEWDRSVTTVLDPMDY